MKLAELLAVMLGGGLTAAVVSGVFSLILWRLNRKAAKEDSDAAKQEKETEYEKHIKKAVCVILYDRIKYLGRHHIGEGYITADDLQDLMNMHKCYHDDLDGNGFLDNVMRQVNALPMRK